MEKQVRKRRHVPNPTGKGGLGDRPEDINRTKPGTGRGHRKKVIFGSEVLADMKAAYSTPPDTKESAGIKAARRLLAKSYEKFMVLYTKAQEEANHLPQESALATVASAEEPLGKKEAKVEDLIETLLKGFETEEASRAAQGTE